MKRKESQEPDLYVINRKLTEKEKQELNDFIREYREKQKKKKSKHKKAA